MFNVGPLELIVLGIVGLVVLGPDKLPDLARDAARMIKTLRELATGARAQLRDELGPEFADVDLRNLNPRTAIQRAVFGDDDVLADLRKFDPRKFDPKAAAQSALFGDDETADAAADATAGTATDAAAPAAGLGVSADDLQAVSTPEPVKPVTFDKRAEARAAAPARPRPRPGPGAAAAPSGSTFDDAT